MFNKITRIFLIVGVLILLTGCGEKKEEEKKEGTLKCDVFKCIELIDYTDKIESINDKIGITGKKNEYVDNSYEWDLSNDVKLRAVYGADGITKLELLFEKTILNDDTLDTSSFKTIDHDKIWEKLFSNGGYNKVVSILGKDGTIISRKFWMYNGNLNIETDYLWIKNDKCYIRASYMNNEMWSGSEIYAGTDMKDNEC